MLIISTLPWLYQSKWEDTRCGHCLHNKTWQYKWKQMNQTKQTKENHANKIYTPLSDLAFYVLSSWTNLKRVFNKQYWMIIKYYSSVQWWCILENFVLRCTKTKQYQVKEFLGFNAITYHGWKVQSMEEQDIIWIDLLQQIYTKHLGFKKFQSERNIRNCSQRVLNRKSTNTDVLE